MLHVRRCKPSGCSTSTKSWSATRMYWEAPQDPIAKEPYTSAGAGAAVGVVMEASATSVRSHVTVPAGMAT